MIFLEVEANIESVALSLPRGYHIGCLTVENDWNANSASVTRPMVMLSCDESLSLSNAYSDVYTAVLCERILTLLLLHALIRCAMFVSVLFVDGEFDALFTVGDGTVFSTEDVCEWSSISCHCPRIHSKSRCLAGRKRCLSERNAC